MNKKTFKLETEVFSEELTPPIKTLSFYFSNLKLLRQGSERKGKQYIIIEERKYMLNREGQYEPFAVFGKSAISLSEMKAAVLRLEMEEQEKNDFNSPQQSKKIIKTWK